MQNLFKLKILNTCRWHRGLNHKFRNILVEIIILYTCTNANKQYPFIRISFKKILHTFNPDLNFRIQDMIISYRHEKWNFNIFIVLYTCISIFFQIILPVIQDA